MDDHSALTYLGILYQEFSSGNVLIYPREYITPHCKLGGIREGLLPNQHDEMSKHVLDAEAGPLSRQPGRTGTWEFVSANGLKDRSKQIVVEDEMESFFHLLLYYALRYLPHNCTNVDDFMWKYFDDFVQKADDRRYSCGEIKYITMVMGQLMPGCKKLTFFREPLPDRSPRAAAPQGASSQGRSRHFPGYHPIGALFGELLTWLKAFYTLCAEQEKPFTHMAPTGPYRHSRDVYDEAIEEEDAVIDAYIEEFERGLGDDHASTSGLSSHLSSTFLPEDAEKRREAVRSELEALAAKLGSHQEVMKLFADCLRKGPNRGWPADDKTADQLSKYYRPQEEREIGVGTKRSFIDSSPSDTGTVAPEPKKERVTSPGPPAVVHSGR
ncbi:hypothetical protein OH77DRAFT_1040128 [Trametes cingulata]|nr:hypothetical protein OH77DRAFT_1040128 [Trametes cingulata]